MFIPVSYNLLSKNRIETIKNTSSSDIKNHLLYFDFGGINVNIILSPLVITATLITSAVMMSFTLNELQPNI